VRIYIRARYCLLDIKLVSLGMKLKDFIEQFVRPNTLVRLWHSVIGGHELITQPSMEWELKDGEYANKVVVGVTDIVVSPHSEAVNIVIEY
jgi:hypothetical protein